MPAAADHINGCNRQADIIIPTGSPEYLALLPYFGPAGGP